MAEPLLNIVDLSVSWGPMPALDRLRLTLHHGQTLGLVGESGSGKSTAIQAALRLLPPPARITGGSVTLDGVDVLGLDEAGLRRLWWERVALVPQGALAALSPLLTVEDHARETFVAHGRPAAAAGPVLAARLAQVGLDPSVARRYPHALSGGMRQRVVIALARLLDPPLLVLDEPTTALDVVVERELLRALLEIQSADRFAMVFVTHDLPLLLQFADTVAVLYAGRLVEVAPAAALRAGGLHPYTQGLLAAMPAGPEEARRPQSIGGAPPDLRHPPTGCRFHPRCPLARPACAAAAPPLSVVSPGHRVACFAVGP